MKIIKDIPDVYCRLIEDGLYKPNPDYLTVTQLINPPLIKHLQIKHWDTIEQNASDFLWMVLGSAVHSAFEKSGIMRDMNKILESHKNPFGCDVDSIDYDDIKTLYDSHYAEKSIESTINGVRIRGKIDFREVGIIRDFKITSVWSFMYGLKKEWIQQLNIYDYMCQDNGLPINEIYVDAILRDWTKTKTYRDKNYPKMPFISLPVKQWKTKEQYNFISQRIQKYKEEPCECSAEEKWEKPTTYAVKKGNNKRAVRVFEDVNDAHNYMNEHKDKMYKIEVRKGEKTRCLHYCPVRSVCPFAPKNKGELF